ncbi:MAG: Bug family tripartite tricarboxylate transporter substrate binding protein [Xanthobacteraceae bacterium]
MAMFLRGLMAAIAALVSVSAPLRGQDYPSHPITFIVGFPPGSSSDIVARNFGARLAERMGKPFVIENKPGAGSIIAAQSVARAAPDGYTIMVAPSGTLAINPALYKSLPYDPLKDFEFVAHTANFPLVLVINPQLPVKSVPELIALGKQKRLTFASSGTGTSIHLAGELFKTMAGIEMTHIPYKGPALAVTDIIAGHVDMIFSDPGTVVPQVKEGKLRALAVTSLERFPVIPDVPTVAESGLPGFDASSWHMIIAPKGTPAPIVNRLRDEFRKMIALPEVKEQLLMVGLVGVESTGPDELRKFVESETARWSKIVQQAGLAGTQ